MRTANMIRKKLLILILILPLSACSTFGLLFDHLPFLTTWRVDSMFDLNDEQEELVEKSTEEIKLWLKQDAFPKLVSHLKEARKLWQEEQFEEASKVFDSQAQAFVDSFLSQVGPYLVKLLLTLDDENMQEYLDYNHEKSQEWFEYAESNENKLDSRIKRLENWFGPLSEEQEKRVSEIVKLLPSERDIRHNNNLHWVRKVIEASLARNRSALENWLADTSSWWLPEYTNLRVQNRNQTLELIDMMINTMTSEQEEHVLAVVDDWVEKLESVN